METLGKVMLGIAAVVVCFYGLVLLSAWLLGRGHHEKNHTGYQLCVVIGRSFGSGIWKRVLHL